MIYLPSLTAPAVRQRIDALASTAPFLQAKETAINDIDDLAAVQVGWSLHYEQLSQGTFHSVVRQIQLPDLQLVCESSSQATRQQGQIGTKDIGFAMGMSPTGVGHFHGQVAQVNSIMVGRGDELDLTLRQGTQLIAVVMREELLSRIWQQLHGRSWEDCFERKIVIPIASASGQMIRSSFCNVVDLAIKNPALLATPDFVAQVQDVVLTSWLESLPLTIDDRDLARAGVRKRIVDRVCDLVLNSPEHPLSILQICQEIGTSPRKLELCFQDVLGMSPHRYLRVVRLCGARRELKQNAGSGTSIHEIAARWGFWHMSAFSVDYKKQFGESPSTTLIASASARRITVPYC